MKFAGVLTLLLAVAGIATFEDAVPAQDRALAHRLVRYTLYLMFVGGLYLFGAGLKREIVAELRGGSPGWRRRELPDAEPLNGQPILNKNSSPPPTDLE